MSAAQVISWLTGSGIGFVAGYLAGRVGRDVSEHHGTDGSRWWSVGRTVIGLLLLGLVAWGVVSGIERADQRRREANCQAEFNEAFVLGLQQRTQAADVEREANKIRFGFLRDAIRNPLAINPSPAQRREFAQRWVVELDRADRLLAEADAQRAAHPIPTPRRC